jgi:branched-chain amino acid transport system permease protein
VITLDIVGQIVLNSLIAGAIYTLITLGFNLIYWITKFFNIAYGIFAVIGAYTVFFLFKIQGFNLYFSVFSGILLAGISGYLSDRFIFLPLRRRNGSRLIMFVASLGLFTAFQAFIAMVFSSNFQILTKTFEAQRSYQVFGGVITDIHILIMVTVVVIMTAFGLYGKKTTFGKSVKAVGDDEEVAKIIGIDTNRVIGYVFFVSSAIAGLGGILVGFDTGLMPTMGMDLLLKGVISSIIGGVGNVYGGVLGAFLLGFVENFGVWKIAGQWKDAIAFGLLILFLLFRPRGILKV